MLANCLVALMSLAAAPNQAAPDTAVVCPAEFRAALAPWIEHRQRQGHTLVLVSNEGGEAAVRERIRDVAKAGGLKFVVLVGDVTATPDPTLARRTIPVRYIKAKVNVHWGSEPELPTDNRYADLDDDRLPDVAIGRLTADTPADLQAMVKKILAYEQNAVGAAWRTRVNIVAGVGGFGALTDAVLETSTKTILLEGLPPSYTSTMTYGSWRSPYFPDPRQFRQVTCDRLSEGSLFWIYIGHGARGSLDDVYTPASTGAAGGAYTPAGRHKILDVSDMPRLRCSSGSPIALFLACYTGAFDSPSDCLAEELLRAPGGPVAIFSGSRMTMPYAMGTMGIEAMNQVFVQRRATVGEVMLHAKRAMMQDESKSGSRRTLDAVAKMLSPKGATLEEERAEHLDLFNLIGDPLLRIRHPRPIELTAAATGKPGDTLRVSGACELDGDCTVELVVRRDRLRFAAPARPTYVASEAAWAANQQTYEQANDTRLASARARVVGGRLTADLKIPAEARGACFVRAYTDTPADFAAGATPISIE